MVFLTGDVGPADAVLGSGHTTQTRWERTEVGLHIIFEVLDSLQDQYSIEMPVTWLVRADSLIDEQFGDCLAIFEKFSSYLQKAARDGHEIGWLPQVYGGRGGTEVNYDDLLLTHAALIKAALTPKTVRMGNCFHDNLTMKILNDLGIEIDSSAVPNRIKNDGGWRMDWQGTKAQAYRPSLADYRLPGVPHLDILEVPLTVRPIKAPYDLAPLLRYLNPCMHRAYFWQNLRDTLVQSSYVVLIFHPDEAAASRNTPGHPLVAYSREEFASNLQRLMLHSLRKGRSIRFCRLRDFPRTLQNQLLIAS